MVDGQRHVGHRADRCDRCRRSRTTARFSSLPTPRIADCGWLMMIGVATSEPETPWLEIENVPPLHIGRRELAGARAFGQRRSGAFGDLQQRQSLRAMDDRHDQTLLAQRRADADIDVVIDLEAVVVPAAVDRRRRLHRRDAAPP